MARADYDRLIDAETWAFIARTTACTPAEADSDTGIAAQRAGYDAMCRAFHAGYPDGIAAQDDRIADVPVRIYSGGTGTVTLIYLHGGGFILGGKDSHDDICAELCARAGLRVVSVDYRLAPEHPHPAALHDCLAVTRTLLAQGPVILAGDSAGGCLAAACAHALRGAPELLGQVLIYPLLGGDVTKGSYVTHAAAPMLTTEDVIFFDGLRHDGPVPDADATASPLQDTDFSRLPSTVVFGAACDPLFDDGRIYCDRISGAGGQARFVPETGMVHGYLRARHSVRRAADSFTRIVDAVAGMAG